MIIALSGKMKSGKDTCADYLVSKGFVKISFADNLKEMCKSVFYLTDDQVYTQEGKEESFEAPLVVDETHVSDLNSWLSQRCKWPLTFQDCLKIHRSLKNKFFYNSREVLQYVGSEVMRECLDPDIHAKILFKVVQENGWKDVVIPDCRFPNEVDAVESNGGKVIRILRPETDINSGSHMSETALDDYCFSNVFYNDSTIEDLYKSIDRYL